MERVLAKQRIEFCRLDGSTEASKRMQIVDRFNRPETTLRVFLLSSKAGGVGLNLIGANRMVLLDPDWNPANDAQAMARVWRDGQKLPVYIYRMISTGTVEEKIFQRQVRKQGLSRSVIDDHMMDKRHFKMDDLKKLFNLNTLTACETHELIKCNCFKISSTESTAERQSSEPAFDDFLHMSRERGFAMSRDSVLSNISCRSLSFVFENETKRARDKAEAGSSASTSGGTADAIEGPRAAEQPEDEGDETCSVAGTDHTPSAPTAPLAEESECLPEKGAVFLSNERKDPAEEFSLDEYL
eukprot:TRINITY_DN25614_c0_g1_i1.p1 TRINITY_DN25614_c0_g1~~TRINITY_DN25614_c0_g1_i1.p1  ORF type:complete len:299 (+),score=69.64 TRINITY_DN25614_c0_g1_i1:78-974(+)